MPFSSTSALDGLRVTRTLRAGQPGTQRLLLRHGGSLVCVRYRENEAGTERFTTIELIIDRRPTPKALVQLAVDWREKALQQKLRQAGAQWNASARCWQTELRIAKRLQLTNRILGPAQGRR